MNRNLVRLMNDLQILRVESFNMALDRCWQYQGYNVLVAFATKYRYLRMVDTLIRIANDINSPLRITKMADLTKIEFHNGSRVTLSPVSQYIRRRGNKFHEILYEESIEPGSFSYNVLSGLIIEYAYEIESDPPANDHLFDDMCLLELYEKM